MIQIDNEKLERVLYEVLSKMYTADPGEDLYLIVEDIDVYPDEDNIKNYSYFVKGRYGREGSSNDFCEQFKIQLEQEWSWDFIAGYFRRVLEVVA